MKGGEKSSLPSKKRRRKNNFLKYVQILLSPKHPEAAIRRNCVTRAQLSWEKGNIWLQPPVTLNILWEEKTQLQIYQAFLFQLKGGRKNKQTNKQKNKTEKHLWRSIPWWHRFTKTNIYRILECFTFRMLPFLTITLIMLLYNGRD